MEDAAMTDDAARIMKHWGYVIDMIEDVAFEMTRPDKRFNHRENLQEMTDNLHVCFHQMIAKHRLSDTPGSALSVGDGVDWSWYDREDSDEPPLSDPEDWRAAYEEAMQ